MVVKNITANTGAISKTIRTLILLLCIIALSVSVPRMAKAQTLTFPKDDGIHESADFEAWSVFSHFATPNGKKFGVAVFFFTGEVIGITASGIYIVVADEEQKTYSDFSKIQIPLFSSTTHTSGGLMENYSDNILKYDSSDLSYNIKIQMDDFGISLKYNPLKEPVDIGKITVGENSFNRIYAVPRGNISAVMNYENKQFKLNGIGIFQHQWGDKPEQRALSDIFALHSDDSTDILIYHSDKFPEINTMIVSDKKGQYSVSRNFTAAADTIFTVESDNDKYKLNWNFFSPKDELNIKILPGFDGQEIEMLGLSYWLSKCKLTLEWNDKSKVKGIGYVYIGINSSSK